MYTSNRNSYYPASRHGSISSRHSFVGDNTFAPSNPEGASAEIDEDDDPGDQSEEELPDLDPISDSEASTDHDDPDSLPDDQDSGSEY